MAPLRRGVSFARFGSGEGGVLDGGSSSHASWPGQPVGQPMNPMMGMGMAPMVGMQPMMGMPGQPMMGMGMPGMAGQPMMGMQGMAGP